MIQFYLRCSVCNTCTICSNNQECYQKGLRRLKSFFSANILRDKKLTSLLETTDNYHRSITKRLILHKNAAQKVKEFFLDVPLSCLLVQKILCFMPG